MRSSGLKLNASKRVVKSGPINLLNGLEVGLPDMGVNRPNAVDDGVVVGHRGVRRGNSAAASSHSLNGKGSKVVRKSRYRSKGTLPFWRFHPYGGLHRKTASSSTGVGMVVAEDPQINPSILSANPIRAPVAIVRESSIEDEQSGVVGYDNPVEPLGEEQLVNKEHNQRVVGHKLVAEERPGRASRPKDTSLQIVDELPLQRGESLPGHSLVQNKEDSALKEPGTSLSVSVKFKKKVKNNGNRKKGSDNKGKESLIVEDGQAQEICETDSDIGRCNLKIVGGSKAQKMWGICKSLGMSNPGSDALMVKQIEALEARDEVAKEAAGGKMGCQ